MTTWYVDSTATGGTGAGTSWANACLTMAAAIALSSAGGADFNVYNGHQETASAALVAYAFKGLDAAPDRVFCCDRTNSPAQASDLSPMSANGGFLATSGNFGMTISGAVYMYGVTFNIGTGTACSATLIVNSLASGATTLDTCAITTGGTTTSSIQGITIGNDAQTLSSAVTFINTTISFGGTAAYLGLKGVNFVWLDTPSAVSGGPSNLFKTTSYQTLCKCIGVDLSNVVSGKNLFASAATASSTVAQFVNCRLASGVVVCPTPNNVGASVDVVNSDFGATGYRFERYQYQGTLTTDTATYKNGGASDDVTSIAWKVVTNANNRRQAPFECFEIVQWVDTTGTSHTATIDILTDNTVEATMTNADIWVDAHVLDNASYPLASKYTTAAATQLTAGTTLATSSATWAGIIPSIHQNTQKMSVTFTSQIKGYVRFSIKVARASLTTLRIDPSVTIV